MARRIARGFVSLALAFWFLPRAFPLDPRKALTQYAQKVWTQEQGLPQDTIRAIAQTTDGYLWLGTDEGLARFDGYDFVVFDKDHNNLPSNSISALAAGADGSLWIGTTNGLAHYANKQFYIYDTNDGLPDDSIADLAVDHSGVLWAVAGVDLARFAGSRFTVLRAGKDIPTTTVQRVSEDRQHNLWVGGFGGVVERAGSRFVPVVSADALNSGNVTRISRDSHGNLWIGSSQGLILRSPDGKIRKYDTRDGLPDIFVRALQVDRDGNVWVGTNSGLARLRNNRFVTMSGPGGQDRDQVRSLFEDREGNLWVGANNGLTRLRDDVFTVYGKSEGLPSDDPNTVFQDHSGRIWIGYHDSGLLLFAPEHYQLFTTWNGLPNNEIFSIRESRDGDLLLGTRGGFVRMHDKHLSTYVPPDELNRELVFDSLEDSAGRLWLALNGGLAQLSDKHIRIVVPGGPVLNDAVVSLAEGRNGVLWAGTYGRGLWRVRGDDKVHYTEANGLSSDQIRAVREDPDGTLWIGTFGGGLNAFRNNQFTHFTAKDGLLSDNISDVADDGESLWLSTTRGICRISKKQLHDFDAHKIRELEPTNYGVEDGLRSAQSAPGYPIPGGGRRTTDGRLWFPTSQGLAVIDPHARTQASGPPPELHMVDMTADGKSVDFSKTPRLPAGSQRIQIRYTAIHLGAPERVRYSHKLEGLDKDWVRAGNRRLINYNTLAHGKYKFRVRAELPGGPASERSYEFEVLPQFYETAWFRLLSALTLIAAGWGLYQLRLRQLASRFALVLEERARMAREIHDTLAQGFVGISSQLDAVALAMPQEHSKARQYLELARKMARHSITEARRSVMDLRASVLEGQDLAAALHSGAQIWTAGSGVQVHVDVSGAQNGLPQEYEQHLLRIAQEAVTNSLKHAGASQIWVKLQTESRKLDLRIVDNGRGFEHQDVFSSLGGHFGLIGMRERAERLGGELHLASHPGEGTQVEVTVPLP
ncbi:MAG TPA: two-component regulator propeller domain-containing protein [Bryobacteraceae bacterium]|nr:two-component regulator propeller domain-containing protein [Bryobacteraceae bacterium]